MTYATTFSGIGGWELGLNACGWELKWQCECEPWCRRLLKKRFGVHIYDDIATICEQNPAPVDALIGSPPCQPFSNVGQKGGTSDSRHLYPDFIKLVRLIKPRWVLIEQVSNILRVNNGEAFKEYISGLDALGFDVLWHCIPAHAVGAPHRRDRLWIIAHSKSTLLSKSWDSWKWGNGFNDSHLHESAWGDSENRVLTPKLCLLGDGVPKPVDELRAIGNAVVPQIPYLIGQAINEIERA